MESLIDGPEPVELALTAVVDRPGTSLVFNRSQSQAQRPMSGVVRPTPSTAAHHERGTAPSTSTRCRLEINHRCHWCSIRSSFTSSHDVLIQLFFLFHNEKSLFKLETGYGRVPTRAPPRNGDQKLEKEAES